MNDINKVIISGCATNEGEMRYTNNGIPIFTFSLATNRSYKQNDEWKTEVCYTEIVTWNKIAEYASSKVSKGQFLVIEGSLKFDEFEDKDGNRRTKHKIIANDIKKLDLQKKDNSGMSDSDIPV